jgi:hypothetical protein
MISAKSYKQGGTLEYQSTYQYDLNGKLVSQVDIDHTNNSQYVTKNVYDIEGRVIASYEGRNTNPNFINDYIKYEYDVKGNLVKIDYPSINDLNIKSSRYTYNNKNQLEKIEVMKKNSNSYEILRNYSYDYYGRTGETIDYLDLSLHSDVKRTSYSYDNFGRLGSINTLNQYQQLLDVLNYSYNLNSQIIIESSSWNNNQGHDNKNYTYDQAGRLKYYTWDNSTIGSSKTDYSYDVVGNRTKESLLDYSTNITTIKNYSYNSLNQLISINNYSTF